MRITAKMLNSACACANIMLQTLKKQGKYDVQYCYGHTDVIFYPDPNSTGCLDVRCGLTKSEAYDVLQGIIHALNTVLYR